MNRSGRYVPGCGWTQAALLALWPLLAALTPLPEGDTDYEDSARHIFLSDELAFVEVTMSPGALDSLIQNPWSDEYRRCSVRFRNSLIDETVENVGIRVRGNTSLTAI